MSGADSGGDSDELEVDFTPMIDVTFLLLIFFMVTTTLAQPTEVKLPRARSGKGETAAQNLIIHLREGDDQSRSFRLNSAEEQTLSLTELKASVTAAESQEMVVLRVDEVVPFAYVDEVASSLRSLGIGRVVLGVKEKDFVRGEGGSQ